MVASRLPVAAAADGLWAERPQRGPADGQPVSPHALFVEYEAEDGAVHAPEVFPRPDGTTYICGLSSEAPLPLDPADVATDADAQAKLKAMIRGFAPALADAEVVAAQACYRPVTRDGLPLIGAVPGVAGAYVATGHSVWGMLNAPATGEAMAELIVRREHHGRHRRVRSCPAAGPAARCDPRAGA